MFDSFWISEEICLNFCICKIKILNGFNEVLME